ncbi:MAG TPA: hypothetical protein VK589_04365 [Chryseolinea sp.]|nr:hypothetical protein [Chryseolinea sp.]
MKDILLIKNGVGATLHKFITALLEPLQTQTNAMKAFEAQEVKRSTWNGQKIVLQAALNDLFGITSAPFIIIETNQDIGQNTYFYEQSELVPVYFSEQVENDPVYFFEDSEPPTIDYDFKVLIPVGIHTVELERQVRAQTYLYKLAGPKFIILTY